MEPTGCWPGCALCLLIKDEPGVLVTSSGPWEALCGAQLCRAQDMLATSPPRIPGHPPMQGFSSVSVAGEVVGMILDQSSCSPKHFPHVGQEPVKVKDVLHIFWRGFGCFGESRLPGSLSLSLPSPGVWSISAAAGAEPKGQHWQHVPVEGLAPAMCCLVAVVTPQLPQEFTTRAFFSTQSPSFPIPPEGSDALVTGAVPWGRVG